MKKRFSITKIVVTTSFAITAIALASLPYGVEAAGSSYVRTVTTTKKDIVVNTGDKVTTDAKVTTKGSASKKVTVASSDKTIASAKVGSPSSTGKSKITITGKRRGTAHIEVTSVGKSSKLKKITKKIKVIVTGTIADNHATIKSFLYKYCGRNSANHPYYGWKYKGNTYREVSNTSTGDLDLTSIIETGTTTTNIASFKLSSNGHSKYADITATLTIEKDGVSKFCQAHATINKSTYNKEKIKFVVDKKSDSLKDDTIQSVLNSGFKTSIPKWDQLVDEHMDFGLYGLGFKKLYK